MLIHKIGKLPAEIMWFKIFYFLLFSVDEQSSHYFYTVNEIPIFQS